MKKIIPYLWFDRQSEEAVNLYVKVFPNARVDSVSRYSDTSSEAAGLPAGTVMSVSFALAGLDMVALNGGPYYQFTPAISFMVYCPDADTVRRIWDGLLPGGQVLMELRSYPFSELYGWLSDRYGVSWQLMISGDPALVRDQPLIVPALLFTGDRYGSAEAAVRFYTANMPDSAIRTMEHQPDGKILYTDFTLHQQLFAAMESGLDHNFTFSPAISFLLECEGQAEVDRLWETLSANGEIMPCGWVTDRFGVTWQVVPDELFALLQDEDTGKAGRAMQAMLEMTRIDLAALRRAFDGE